MSFSSHFLRICIYNTPPLLLGIRKSVLVLHHTICSIICIFLFILACSQRQQIRTHSFPKKKISYLYYPFNSPRAYPAHLLSLFLYVYWWTIDTHANFSKFAAQQRVSRLLYYFVKYLSIQ